MGALGTARRVFYYFFFDTFPKGLIIHYVIQIGIGEISNVAISGTYSFILPKKLYDMHFAMHICNIHISVAF